MTYPIIPFVPWIEGNLVAYQARMAVGAAFWIGLAVVLMCRRDWRGAAAITVFYLLVDAFWWVLALGIIHFD